MGRGGGNKYDTYVENPVKILNAVSVSGRWPWWYGKAGSFYQIDIRLILSLVSVLRWMEGDKI